MGELLLGFTVLIGGVAAITLVLKSLFSLQERRLLKQQNPEDDETYSRKFGLVNPHRFRNAFFPAGLACTLGFVAWAFTLKEEIHEIEPEKDAIVYDDFIQVPPRTVPPKKELPPPPKDYSTIKVVANSELLDEFQKEEPPIEMIAPPISDDFIEEIDRQESSEPKEKPPVIRDWAEVMPEFPGGQTGLMKFLGTAKYPTIAKENDIEGTVHVRFVVNKTGKVTDVEVMYPPNKRKPDKILIQAAIKHIKNMPGWKPGEHAGRPVNVQFVVPMKYKLN